MNRAKVIYGFGFAALLLIVGAADLHAQETPQDPVENMPKAAARSLPPIDANTPQDDIDALVPDSTSLTGAQNPTLGSNESRHSYWVPGVQFASSIQSPQDNQSNSSWSATNYIIGNVGLLQNWSRAQLTVNYSGGGYFSTSGSQQGNGVYQQLAIAQTFQINRLTLQLMDQFSYLPQSQFGFGGGTNLGIPGVGGSGPSIPGLGNSYVPNQSIFASLGPRYSNAGVVQATYTLSPRSSITSSGSYGILRFVDPGNVDNNTIIGSIGYNYVLTRKDTIGLVYRYSSYQYPGEPQAFQDQIVNFAYSRKLTGKIALQLSGGPDFTKYRVPIGTTTSTVSANANVSFNYALQNGSLTASYLHGLTGGGGVLTGSNADTLSFGISHNITRVWSGQLNVGYSNNRPVTGAGEDSPPSYKSLYINAGVSRPIGRNLTLALAYSANIGTTVESGCTTGSCTADQTTHYITMNFQWHSRPLILP